MFAYTKWFTTLCELLAVFILSTSLANAQTITTVPILGINTSTVGETSQFSNTIFTDFRQADDSGTIGLGGQSLFQFTILSANPTEVYLSTCEGSDFHTHLVLFDRDPRDNVTELNDEGEEISRNATAIAESASDILCKVTIKRATILVILNKGTYYVLLTGDGKSFGAYNLTLIGTPKFETNIPSWHLDRIDQRYLPMNNKYTVNRSADDVLVYLIDSGVNIHHEEFEGRVRTGYDFVRYKETDAPDCTGHGTHIAGLIAGRTYGVAKKAEIISLRVYGCSNRASVTAIVNALHWVLAHSKSNCFLNRCVVALMVANKRQPSSVFRSVLDGFARREIPVVVPAGDHNSLLADGGDACSIFPANRDDFLSVGATTSEDARASFSNKGSCVDLFAPGSKLRSAWHTSNNATRRMSGTAQASAIVAGVTAILLSINNGLAASEAKNILESISTPRIFPLSNKDEDARLVYVRSVPTDRLMVPPQGDVLLKTMLQVNMTSCEAGQALFLLLRRVISEKTGVELNRVNLNCDPVGSTTRFFAWDRATDFNERAMLIKETRQEENPPILLNLEISMTLTERKASAAFLALERVLEKKEDIEEEVSFRFVVSIMPWATDSREVIYWGAPTFPTSQDAGLSIGIIIAIIMSIIVILVVIGVTGWLWHRRVTRKDEITEMEGSADMERGPVHFRDFEDDESNRSLNKMRSFRNVGGVSTLGGRSPRNEHGANGGLSSLSSFVHRSGTDLGSSIRLNSYGGEAFAGINYLGADEDKAKAELENDRNWRQTNPGRLNSIARIGDDGEEQVTFDDIRVKSMGGEAFAMLANMASSDVEFKQEEEGRDISEEAIELSAGRSRAGGATMGFMETEPGERMVNETDMVAMSPRGPGPSRRI